MTVQDATQGLTLHDLLVQLIRERESTLLTEREDYDHEERRQLTKELDADALAYLIEEVLGLAAAG